MERGELEHVWQKRVSEAADQYRHAVEQFQTTLTEHKLGEAPRPDGSHAVRVARHESYTRAEYMRVLRLYTDLVTKGAVPQDLVKQEPDLPMDGGPAGENGLAASHLTPRELQVVSLVAAGRTGKEIAGALGITFKTVACHRTRIMDKLGCRNVADLTRAAIRMGLIQP